MADYKNMTAIEALREAKDASGMTAESIAQGAGITAERICAAILIPMTTMRRACTSSPVCAG